MRSVLLLFVITSLLPAQSTLFEHTRVIDGTGRVYENASLLVNGARIGGINVRGAKGVTVVDLAGKTIIPGLINAHGHLGVTHGTKSGPENFTEASVAAQLEQYARYGVTSVLSMGLNLDLIYELRARQQRGATIYTAGRGIGVPGGAPPLNVAAAQVYRPTNPQEARAAVREMAGHGVDMIKIWVDDVRGTMPKMQPEIYRAVIAEAHQRRMRVAAHVFYLADAAALVETGVDVIAHSIRDKDVDAGLVQAMKQKRVYYIPTLELDESFFLYAKHPEFLNNPFVAGALNSDVRTMLLSREWRERVLKDPSMTRNEEAYQTAARNLRTLHTAGVKIAMGTDSGATPLRIQGWAEHLELELMTQAGLKPLDAIISATREAAAVCGAADRGTLQREKIADFVVLDANPLTDIRNTRAISAVWHNGRRIELRH